MSKVSAARNKSEAQTRALEAQASVQAAASNGGAGSALTKDVLSEQFSNLIDKIAGQVFGGGGGAADSIYAAVAAGGEVSTVDRRPVEKAPPVIEVRAEIKVSAQDKPKNHEGKSGEKQKEKKDEAAQVGVSEQKAKPESDESETNEVETEVVVEAAPDTQEQPKTCGEERQVVICSEVAAQVVETEQVVEEVQADEVVNAEVALDVNGGADQSTEQQAKQTVEIDAQAAVEVAPEHLVKDLPIKPEVKATAKEAQAAAPEAIVTGHVEADVEVSEDAGDVSHVAEDVLKARIESLTRAVDNNLKNVHNVSTAAQALKHAVERMTKTGIEGQTSLTLGADKSTGITAAGGANGMNSLHAQNPGAALGRKADVTRGESKPAKELSNALQRRTMERVDSVLREVARSKDGKTISLRLDPPDLGTVKVDISFREGSLHVRFAAENPQVAMLLRDRSSDVQSTLRKLGLDLEQVSVSVSSDEGGDTQQQAGQQQGEQQLAREWQGEAGQHVAAAHVAGETKISGDARADFAYDHWVA